MYVICFDSKSQILNVVQTVVLFREAGDEDFFFVFVPLPMIVKGL